MKSKVKLEMIILITLGILLTLAIMITINLSLIPSDNNVNNFDDENLRCSTVTRKIHIKGNTTDFEDTVASMQIERKDVKNASKGDHIGIKVPEKVRPNDTVFLVE